MAAKQRHRKIFANIANLFIVPLFQKGKTALRVGAVRASTTRNEIIIK